MTDVAAAAPGEQQPEGGWTFTWAAWNPPVARAAGKRLVMDPAGVTVYDFR
jgi:hypothetical protein